MEYFDPAVSGFFLGLSLIIAIGAQNAFVLRQGLMKKHVFAITTICFLSDAMLIFAGVMGLGTFVKKTPVLLTVITSMGALFLFVYGAMALRRSFLKSSMKSVTGVSAGLKASILFCLAITWGNPHVYLDTVVLLGSLSARYSETGQIYYAFGGATASFIWFYALGYGARLLAPIFSEPVAWRLLDIGICLVMWGIALSLVVDFVL